MKILLISHIYPPAIDGGSKVIAKIGQYLESQGHQIMILTTNCRSSDDFSKIYDSELHSKPPVYRLPVITIFHHPIKLISKLFPILGVFSKGPIFLYLPLIKIISFHPDLIIAGPLPTTVILYANLLKKLTGAKLLSIPCFHPSDSDFQNSLLKKSLSGSDYIVAFTKVEKQLIRQFSAAKIIVQPPGVDSDFLIDPSQISFPENPNILFIANFSAHKRVELLLEAFYQVQKTYPQISLTLLGQKTLYWPTIQSKINPLPIKIKLIFDPTPLQIKQSIDRCSFLCLPSIHESFGLVFVESLARCKPVIGADTPQTSEVINLIRGGITFKTDDLQDLILKIKSLLDNPSSTSQLGLTGYKFVKNHLTWDKIGKNLWSKISSS